MATRFHFTTRDWIWFCIVIALAFGWSGHFRYSKWLENNWIASPPYNTLGTTHTHYIYDADLMRERNNTIERTSELEVRDEAYKNAISRLLSDEQKKELAKLIEDYLESKGYVRQVSDGQ
jgi:hypothetical protein